MGTTLLSGGMVTLRDGDVGCKRSKGLGAMAMGDARDEVEAEAERGLDSELDIDAGPIGGAVMDEEDIEEVRDGCWCGISNRGS